LDDLVSVRLQVVLTRVVLEVNAVLLIEESQCIQGIVCCLVTVSCRKATLLKGSIAFESTEAVPVELANAG
jgi:hypothetical protein